MMLRLSCEPARDWPGDLTAVERVPVPMSAAYLKAPEALPSTQIPYWCAGKQSFDSPVHAHLASGRRRDCPREHYRCRSCGKFHVGTAGGGSTMLASALGLIR